MKKQFVSMLLVLVAVTALGGERSSGGRIRAPKAVGFVFFDKPDPKADWSGFESEYGSDLKVIEEIASQELASGKLLEFRKDVVELEKVGRDAHAKKPYYVACVAFENYSEESRVQQAITQKLKHRLPVVYLENCEWDGLQGRYKNSDRI